MPRQQIHGKWSRLLFYNYWCSLTSFHGRQRVNLIQLVTFNWTVLCFRVSVYLSPGSLDTHKLWDIGQKVWLDGAAFHGRILSENKPPKHSHLHHRKMETRTVWTWVDKRRRRRGIDWGAPSLLVIYTKCVFNSRAIKSEVFLVVTKVCPHCVWTIRK